MKTTLNIPKELLEEAVLLSDVRTKTEVVKIALRNFIHQQKIEKIIKEAGNLEFSKEWEKARHDR